MPPPPPYLSRVPLLRWFHFTRGDNLLFQQWAPSKAGEFAGACIALVALAVVDRFVSQRVPSRIPR